MAGAGLHIDPQSVSHRCTVESPDYQPLTPLDWVVLDFTDGKRSFEDISNLVPATAEQLAESYIHLRLLKFITWESASKRSESPETSRHRVNSMRMTLDDKETTFNSKPSANAAPSLSVISDEVCAQYLPAHWIPKFRAFQAELTDETLDIPIETQLFAEFIYLHLSSMTHQDLLCLPEGCKDKAKVRQGYMVRTKQFHPDRYFRKNIGPFTPRLRQYSRP